jgi:hypothetical protein
MVSKRKYVMAEFTPPEVQLDAPIPGQSLTAPLGERPWQSPPQYVDAEDALEYYIPKILDPAYTDRLLDILETGVPITVLVNTLQTAMVMEGKHTIDVGVLVMPVLIELIELVAMNAGIDFVKGTEGTETEKLSEEKMAKIIRRIKDKEGEALLKETEESFKEDVAEVSEPEEKGLMSRRVS